jgi:hypothetical protein
VTEDGAAARERSAELFGLDGPCITILVAGLIVLKLAELFVLAWNRRFVMDEFVQFGWAKYIPGQIGAFAATQVKAEGYAFFFYPAHLIGWNARSMLLTGRMETALLACGTLGIVYATARALGQSRVRALAILLVLLSFSNFIERIFETRGDPLSVFFAAAALLVAVRAEGRWAILGAGALAGLAFLLTQKAVYFDVALGLALVGDAALARRYAEGVKRGALLVLGWVVPIAVYCLALGGGHALAVAHNLFFGPAAVMSPQTAAEYGGLRQYVVQTLVRNVLLYAFCFAGMLIALLRITRLGSARRIALIFSVIVTALVFAHNQPWPYVFVMALPFMALWALEPFDALAARPLWLPAAKAVLAVAVAASFVGNVRYLRIDNHDQLALVARAESLVGPNEVYFDGVGMLPNRREPSALWLDRHAILQTLREGKRSEAWRIFVTAPPKLILWSYRMEAIEPVIAPLLRDSYVQVAPNIRMAGVRLRRGVPAAFKVPIAGKYALYDSSGRPVAGQLQVDGLAARRPLLLGKGRVLVTLVSGPEALLVPEGAYAGRFSPGNDNRDLFAHVYD